MTATVTHGSWVTLSDPFPSLLCSNVEPRLIATKLVKQPDAPDVGVQLLTEACLVYCSFTFFVLVRYTKLSF